MSAEEEPRLAWELIAILAERWPQCFAVYEKYRRPLKVGIHSDLFVALDGQVSKDEIRAALCMYVANLRYLKTRAGTQRIDLNGEPAGTVTKLEQADAENRIIWRKRNKAEEEVEEQAQARGWEETKQQRSQGPDGEWARKLHPANAAKQRLTLKKGRQP